MNTAKATKAPHYSNKTCEGGGATGGPGATSSGGQRRGLRGQTREGSGWGRSEDGLSLREPEPEAGSASVAVGLKHTVFG
eukprot:2940847-Rhodomonas_salina.1